MSAKAQGKRHYRYFVEHHDDHTNEVLARHLVPQYDCEPRMFWTGRVAPAWEVPDRRFVNFLENSRASQNLKFDAFIQEDNYPLSPFPWPFDAAKAQHKPRKKKAA